MFEYLPFNHNTTEYCSDLANYGMQEAYFKFIPREFYKREKILKPQNYLPQYFNACMAFGREASETHEKFIRKLFS